jgi:uncharacterized protein YodC (DUF2158 family)
MIQVGDTVYLKSNPELIMTVVEIGEEGQIICKWITKNGLIQQQSFPAVALVLA